MKLSASKLIVGSCVALAMALGAQAAQDQNLVKLGEKIFNTKKLGNCLACHDVNGKKIDNPGSLGPKLTGLKYWDDKMLYDTIYDIYKARGIKYSAMPPFGANGWLSEQQIKALVAYLKTVQ